MSNQKLIFVVDDDPFINMLVVKRFTSEGYIVEAFETGEESLQAIDRNPDLVILDYLFVSQSKEIMNGMEVFDKIKKIKPDLSLNLPGKVLMIISLKITTLLIT